MRPASLIGIVLASVLAACGTTPPPDDTMYDCTMEKRADTFVVGLQKVGSGGTLQFQLMSADPAPPSRGDNTWIVQVNAMASGAAGAPVTGASLDVVPFMPDHAHGTPIAVVVSSMPTAGQYKLSPVNMWMPGLWDTTIRATEGTTSDTVVYRFCIPN